MSIKTPGVKITAYNAVCNLGGNIETIYEKAMQGNIFYFNYLNDYISNKWVYAGAVKSKLPEITLEDYNTRCNRLAALAADTFSRNIRKAVNQYPLEDIAVITAGMNTGLHEFEMLHNKKHCTGGASSEFLRGFLEARGYYASVSAGSSSGIKALSLARELLLGGVCRYAVVSCAGTFSRTELSLFNSSGLLSNKPAQPFSKNHSGMNTAEGCSVFILESAKYASEGIDAAGIGESFKQNIDAQALEEAVLSALEDAKLNPEDVDYINAYGTGIAADDLIETQALNKIFGNSAPASSVKPVIGHCLGASAGIETALCCALIDNFKGSFYPHIYDGEYAPELPVIKLVQKNDKYEKCDVCLNISFDDNYAAAAVLSRAKK